MNSPLKNHSLASCFGTALHSCDRFLEEDCTYDMLKDDSTIPSSPVADAAHCQEECQKLVPICRYWVYQNMTCYLMKSGKRNCSVISGPKFPQIATCPSKKFLRPFDIVFVVRNLLLRFATYLITNLFS